ncbi:MAG: tetratricopeptide repeat protein, partial [Candidatus Sericytochromatia bacterium]
MIVRPIVAIAGLPLAGLLLWTLVPSRQDLAEFAAQSGAWSQAADLLEQAVAVQPHDSALLCRLIEAYHQA